MVAKKIFVKVKWQRQMNLNFLIKKPKGQHSNGMSQLPLQNSHWVLEIPFEKDGIRKKKCTTANPQNRQMEWMSHSMSSS